MKTRLKKTIADRPWIWLVLGSLLLLGMAVATLVIAVKNPPQEVPLETFHGR